MKRILGLFILTGLFIIARAWLDCQPAVRAADPAQRTVPFADGSTVRHSDEQIEPTTRLAPSLLKQIQTKDAGAWHRVIIELVPQANLSSQPSGRTRLDQRKSVVAQLQATAQGTQSEIRAELEAARKAGHVQEIRAFWVFNGMAVTADGPTLLNLAAQPQVRLIREDRWRQWIDPLAAKGPEMAPETGDSEWNITHIGADQAWSALGLDGTGVTVAILDTGVDWQHPALQANYRGYKPQGLTLHEGNWFCTTDEGYLYPVDGDGHGTHVAGTAVGGQDGSGTAIGVAPGASWIAVKMLNDSGGGYDSWIHAAFEWILAPAGDPALAPDVINGSWGGTSSSDPAFQPDLQALRAAGIVPVFSAGNEGPLASSLRHPGSYPEAITVGATDERDQVASFSSRGPSPWGEIKPEIAAPGVQIRSSFPGGTYRQENGTSMASPHVAGLVALLLQAEPSLSGAEIEDILTLTAVPLEAMVPNNNSGWGRIDAYQAAAVALKAGYVDGRVLRQQDREPLPGVKIAAYDHLGERRATALSNEVGNYQIALPPGTYRLEASTFGFEPLSVPNLEIQASQTVTHNLVMVPLSAGVLWGQITNQETGGPVGAAISILDTPAQTDSDAQTGQYSLTLPQGEYTVQIAQNGYRRALSSSVRIQANEDKRLDVELEPAPTLLVVDSGQWYYGSQIAYFGEALTSNDYVYDLWEIHETASDVPTLDDLLPYEVTVWSSPQDSPGLVGAGDIVSGYLASGGNLVLSGQDIGYWDGGLSLVTGHAYLDRILKVEAVADDAGQSEIRGVPDDILESLVLTLNSADSAGNQQSPDAVKTIDPRDAAILARNADSFGAATRASQCQSYRAILFAAGLEGLGNQEGRTELMDRCMSWIAQPHPALAADLFPLQQSQVWIDHGASITYTVNLRNLGSVADQFSLALSSSGWTATTWDRTFSQPLSQSLVLGVCQTQTIGVQIIVPAGVKWNETNTVTLTARSQADPLTMAQATLSSKAPAPVLVVDDHRWYDTADSYQEALEANHIPYDLYHVDQSMPSSVAGPLLQTMQSHPVVLWFTAYDWYKTLTPQDEERLGAFLDGGGRLLLSSQDYLYTSGFTDFAREYLGIAGYTESLTATQVTGAAGNPIGAGIGPLNLTYPFQNWGDSLHMGSGTKPVLWSQLDQPVAVSKEQPGQWKTAFFALPLEACDAPSMATILDRTIDWLAPLGDSILDGAPTSVKPGSRLSYTLTMRNSSALHLSQVTLSNTLPLEASIVTASLTGPATYDPVLRRISWKGALAAGQALMVGYQVDLDASLPAGTTVANTAHLMDETGLAIERTAYTHIDKPDLSSSVKVAAEPVTGPSQVLTFTITLRNSGLQPANAHMADPLPNHTRWLPVRTTASEGSVGFAEGALMWTGTISAGQSISIVVPLWISPSAVSLYLLNRAGLYDGWDNQYSVEAHAWVQARIFLPTIWK